MSVSICFWNSAVELTEADCLWSSTVELREAAKLQYIYYWLSFKRWLLKIMTYTHSADILIFFEKYHIAQIMFSKYYMIYNLFLEAAGDI